MAGAGRRPAAGRAGAVSGSLAAYVAGAGCASRYVAALAGDGAGAAGPYPAGLAVLPHLRPAGCWLRRLATLLSGRASPMLAARPRPR